MDVIERTPEEINLKYYDGNLIGDSRVGTNSLSAENHRSITFDIDTPFHRSLLKEIEEKYVKPVNDYWKKKSGRDYVAPLLEERGYKGYTDISALLTDIFYKAVKEWSELSYEEAYDGRIEETKRHIDSDPNLKSKEDE